MHARLSTRITPAHVRATFLFPFQPSAMFLPSSLAIARVSHRSPKMTNRFFVLRSGANGARYVRMREQQRSITQKSNSQVSYERFRFHAFAILNSWRLIMNFAGGTRSKRWIVVFLLTKIRATPTDDIN